MGMSGYYECSREKYCWQIGEKRFKNVYGVPRKFLSKLISG